MSMLMYDSVNAPAIPRDAAVVAGYGDGNYLWPPSWWDLFPGAVHLVIVVSAAHSGDILDVETGDATPADVPGWVRRFNRPGRRRPTVYSNRSTWPQIVAALEAAGLSAAAVDWWTATLDGTQDVPGAVAVQYQDPGTYDVSVVLDPSWVGGSMATLDDISKQLQQVQDGLVSVWLFLLQGYDAPPAGAPAGAPPQHDSILLAINGAVQQLAARSDPAPAMAAVKAELDALKAEVEAGGSPDASAAVARIEKALQTA